MELKIRQNFIAHIHLCSIYFSGMRLKTMFLTEGSNGTSIRSIAPFSSEIKKT